MKITDTKNTTHRALTYIPHRLADMLQRGVLPGCVWLSGNRMMSNSELLWLSFVCIDSGWVRDAETRVVFVHFVALDTTFVHHPRKTGLASLRRCLTISEHTNGLWVIQVRYRELSTLLEKKYGTTTAKLARFHCCAVTGIQRCSRPPMPCSPGFPFPKERTIAVSNTILPQALTITIPKTFAWVSQTMQDSRF